MPTLTHLLLAYLPAPQEQLALEDIDDVEALLAEEELGAQLVPGLAAKLEAGLGDDDEEY